MGPFALPWSDLLGAAVWGGAGTGPEVLSMGTEALPGGRSQAEDSGLSWAWYVVCEGWCERTRRSPCLREHLKGGGGARPLVVKLGFILGEGLWAWRCCQTA